MKPVLQVALDLMHLKRAMEIAKEALEGGVDWIEVGTPLLKSEGVEAVRALKKAYPGHTLVADMKTMDVGGFEVEIAAKAGADIITVMGLADDSTISESANVAKRYGAKIMIDMMNVEDKVARSKKAAELGAGYICLHVGIDEQMRGGVSMAEQVRQVVQAVPIPVAVAGGITSETVAEVLNAGASIVIVGGGIIKTENVTEAAARMKKAMTEKRNIHAGFEKKYTQDELFEAFSKVSTPNIADAMHKRGVMEGLSMRNPHGTKLVGKALTVQTSKGDWAKPVEAIDHATKGDVIVVDAGGSEIAVWGELASWSARMMGVAGVVIDGSGRDIDAIIDMEFPIFCRHTSPHAGEPKGYGGIGHEIICGGQVVRNGDWIIGDESGIMVVPQENAVEIANRAVDVMERENRIREEIKRGRTLSSVQELEKWEQIR
ncbi:MAG: Bifunctional enzyme Fae/Hps [Methanomassiliicoccales archaeon PtaU1.Bin124]|nr:MAG: Bifunctional enzyme Fae/Hps [Methanomassiliicoccales archaeon PtaU1.Bin124]